MNKVMRVRGGSGIPTRYWGRLVRVKTIVQERTSSGRFSHTKVVVKPTNRKNPLVVSKKHLLER